MKFTKMHGCGNDYVYVNCLENEINDVEKLAIKISDRHTGVGADGLILIQQSDVADFRMKMYNADGSEGAMCGNGIRCIAKFVYDKGLTTKKLLNIETKSGIKNLDLHVVDGVVYEVTVNMGSPVFDPLEIPVLTVEKEIVGQSIDLFGEEYKMTCVSMGNPHAVLWVDDVFSTDIKKLGEYLQNSEMFPDSVNVEFIHVIDRKTIDMRVYERGSGETLACGTGACASVVAGVVNGLLDNEVTVHLLGGNLRILFDRQTNQVLMTGPATTVFEGEYVDR